MASSSDGKGRRRLHSAEFENTGINGGMSPKHSSTLKPGRNTVPTLTITPPVSPTRRVDITDYGLLYTPTTQKDHTGSLDRKTVRSGGGVGTRPHSTIVKVYISLTQYKMGTHHNPCSLQALGIVPKRHSITDRNPFATLRPHKSKSPIPVTIRGIIPSSPVALTDQLSPGDQILMVNGQIVNLKTIDNILSSCTNEIIIDVLKYEKDIPPDHTFSPPPSSVSLSDWSETPPPPVSETIPLVLLLTLDAKEDGPPESDILFKYPSIDRGNPFLVNMTQLRGVVATLCDICSTHFTETTSTTCCSFAMEGEEVIACGRRFDREVFLLALPAKESNDSNIMMMYDSIVETFTFLSGSIKTGFLSHDYDPTHILSSLFRSLLSSQPHPTSHAHFIPSCSLLFTSPLVPMKLQISSRTKALISMQLNQLDSGLRRPSYHDDTTNPALIPCGSCLFYKGYLVASHLPPHLMRGVAVVCIINELLSLTTSGSVAQTVAWRKIHQTTPTSETTPSSQTTPTGTCIQGYSTYVLAMAMDQMVLCQVLEGVVKTKSAPPNYCKVLREIVEELCTAGLISDCEGCVLSQTPVLTTADVLLASLVTSSHTSQKKSNSIKRTSAGSMRSISITESIAGSESDSDTDSMGMVYSPQKKHGTLKSMFSSSLRKSKSTQTFRDQRLYHDTLVKPPYMLVAGTDNLLLYFLTLDVGRGVVLCPCREQIGLQPVHRDLLKGFKEVAGSIHQLLRRKYHQAMPPDDWEEEGSLGEEKRGVFSLEGSRFIEHGVLMECTIPNDIPFKAPKLLYWIVGRLFIEDNVELYICYQENASQMTSEMMFKLVFGTPP